MRLSLLLATFFLAISSFSQTVIKGNIRNASDGSPVMGANILVKNPLDSITIAFGFSDEIGHFEIEVTSELDSMLLWVSSMTIQKKTMLLPVSQQIISIEVEAASLNLNEVVVDGIKNPISFSKDTLNYDISGFSTSNDRVLSDVLARLPGIEVLDNGMIQYQGRPLIKFYIDGLDLLQGSYNLANKNLPIDAVESVELLENHQPIRVLDSLVFSDRAALNVKLKRKNAWIGVGSLAAGARPFLGQVNFSPMLFSNQFQTLLSFQANNIGEDLGENLKNLTLSDLQELNLNSPLKDWVYFPSLEVVGLPKKRVLFNESFLGSVNILTKNNQATEFRLNVGFSKEDFRQELRNSTTYYLPNSDTVRFYESSMAGISKSKLSGELNWNKNISKKYVDNTLSIDLEKKDFNGTIYFNQEPVNEFSSLPKFKVGNKLKLLTPIKNKLGDFKSFVTYQKTEQTLNVDIQEETHKDIPQFLGNAAQNIEFNKFLTDNSLGINLKPFKRVGIQSNLGIKVELEDLGTDLLMDSIPEDEFLISNRNAVNSREITSYFYNSINFQAEDFQVKFDFPFYASSFSRNDQVTDQNLEQSKVYFQPYLFVKYQFDGKISNSFSFRKTNNFELAESYFPSRILKSFRNIEIGNSQIPEDISYRFNYGLDYKNPISGLFFELSVAYSIIQKNVLDQYHVIDSGLSLVSLTDRDNRVVRKAGGGKASKYFSQLYTTMTLSGSAQQQNFSQINNGELVGYSTQSYSSGLNISVKPKSYFGIDINTGYQLIAIERSSQELSKIKQVETGIDLDFFPNTNHLLKTELHYIVNHSGEGQSKQLSKFVDFTYRYKLPNSRLDFSLVVNNIFNSNEYTSYFTNGFGYAERLIPLRPRQFLLRIDYSF
ncbi:hypothetical protein [Algoriphagus sp. PAP.12]|uniref:hypothetical protein n=1 Tax=Algoriphagus sp. PAP.12 TaxID=2996678 RepID=UPI00227B13B2|nr:hypothetical protein [Algoriphagus sp. PAP.12]